MSDFQSPASLCQLSPSDQSPISDLSDVSGSEGFVDLGLHPGLPHHASTQTGWEGRFLSCYYLSEYFIVYLFTLC